jgi:hypothetical protein
MGSEMQDELRRKLSGKDDSELRRMVGSPQYERWVAGTRSASMAGVISLDLEPVAYFPLWPNRTATWLTNCRRGPQRDEPEELSLEC